MDKEESWKSAQVGDAPVSAAIRYHCELTKPIGSTLQTTSNPRASGFFIDVFFLLQAPLRRRIELGRRSRGAEVPGERQGVTPATNLWVESAICYDVAYATYEKNREAH